MPDLDPRELLREWQRVMDSLLTSAAGRAELPRQLVEPMQRQLDLLTDIVERERRLQREVAGRLLAPLDAVFDLLEQSAVATRKQAEALQTAGRALEESASVMRVQAALFEKTLSGLRQPTELAKAAVGLERRAPKGRKPRG